MRALFTDSFQLRWETTDTRLLLGLLLVLLAMTGIATMLRARARTDRARAFARDFGARTAGWWLVVLVFVPAILAGGWLAVALFGFAALLAWHEFSTITGAAALRFTDAWWTAPVVAAQFVAAAGAWSVIATMAASLVAIAVITRATRLASSAWREAGWRAIGFLYCVALLSVSAALVVRFDPRWLFFTAVVVQASDVAQYLCGKRFGRRALAPRLSPHKTWEGFAGGVLAAALLGGALAPIVGRGFGPGVALGAALALGGVAGGLAMSAVKRQRGVKDFSRLLPGHGGLMDRLDSLCIACAVTLLFVAR